MMKEMRRAWIALAALVSGLAPLAVSAEVTVRVQRSAAGVPQLQVNGNPVPPRLFFGREGSAPLIAEPEWKDFSYSFSCADDDRGTVHIRFGSGDPGRVEFKNLHVTDIETGEELAESWSVFPRAYGENVSLKGGVLKIDVPARRPSEDFHVSTVRRPMRRGAHCRIVGSVRAETSRVIRFGAYLVNASGAYESMTLVGNDPFPREVALATEAGVGIVSYEVPKSLWIDDEVYDFAELDRISGKILAANPSALLLPRVKIDTSGWWALKHPEDQMVFEDGRKPGVPCISSRLYREKACSFLEAIVRHLCARYPDNFAGIHPAAQNSSEWFYWGSPHRPLNGYDAATRKAWRKWLAEKGEPNAASAEVPSAASRRKGAGGFLRDPVLDRSVIQFSQFQQEEMVDFIAAVARTCRKASEEKKLVVFFYGYPWEFARHYQGPAVTGHLGLQRLLDRAASDIDVLCAPISYFDRAWGECGQIMGPAETVLRRGILWLSEDDTRTFLVPDKLAAANFGVCQTLRETREVLRRNVAQEILRGYGCWWMDLMGSGWYESADLWSELRALGRFDQELLGRKTPFVPEVATIADERSLLAVANGAATERCMGLARNSFARAGAPYGQYLISDVLTNGIPAKLQVFQSAFCSDAQLVAAVAAQRVAQPEVTRVWCWAPGYLTEQGADVKGVENLTGFKVKPIKLADARPRATAVGRAVGLPGIWGDARSLNPLLAVKPEVTDEVWATFEDGSPAIVLRGKEVLVASPDWCTELVRALARRAGVHVYLESGEAYVMAAEGWLMFHALKDGELVLDTGSLADVIDYYSGEQVSTGPRLVLGVHRGETRVFRISDVNLRK